MSTYITQINDELSDLQAISRQLYKLANKFQTIGNSLMAHTLFAIAYEIQSHTSGISSLLINKDHSNFDNTMDDIAKTLSVLAQISK